MKSTCFAQHRGRVITQMGCRRGRGGEIYRPTVVLPQTCFLAIVVVCPKCFQCHKNQNCLHLLKTPKDRNRNPWSQKLSRGNHFCLPFVGLNVPVLCKRLGCFRKCIFRLLESRKEKRQSQKELSWNEKHFPGRCPPELIRSSIGG